MGQQDVISSAIGARSSDIEVEQRRPVGRWRLRGLAIELAVEAALLAIRCMDWADANNAE
jgi:hypothetical protein